MIVLLAIYDLQELGFSHHINFVLTISLKMLFICCQIWEKNCIKWLHSVNVVYQWRFTDREIKQYRIYWRMKERKEKKQKDHKKCTKLQQLSGFWGNGVSNRNLQGYAGGLRSFLWTQSTQLTIVHIPLVKEDVNEQEHVFCGLCLKALKGHFRMGRNYVT